MLKVVAPRHEMEGALSPETGRGRCGRAPSWSCTICATAGTSP
jgi:hypothetical protein